MTKKEFRDKLSERLSQAVNVPVILSQTQDNIYEFKFNTQKNLGAFQSIYNFAYLRCSFSQAKDTLLAHVELCWHWRSGRKQRHPLLKAQAKLGPNLPQIIFTEK